MFKLSDAELLEFIKKRQSERESKTSVASTEELITNLSNEHEHYNDDVFNDGSNEDKTRKEIKEEKRYRQVQGDITAVNSFLKATEVVVDDDGPKHDFDVPIEVTKALLLLGFSNWSSLESGKLIY